MTNPRPAGPSSDKQGPLMFARYAYPPNALGYCGPAEAGDVAKAVAGNDTDALRRLAREFAGAWPYLELIAGCNDLDDPLGRAVVEAYWVGNPLLDQVVPAALRNWSASKFRPGIGPHEERLTAAAATGVAHHSFHVFAVYPWLGMLRAGRADPALNVLDQCRIRWGAVEEVAGGSAVVRSRGLRFDGHRLTLGAPRSEHVRMDAERLADLRPGEAVSLHWDWVCERLTPTGLAALRSCTARNLEAVNS